MNGYSRVISYSAAALVFVALTVSLFAAPEASAAKAQITVLYVVAGGLHLVVASDADIAKIVTALHDTYRVEYVAPGHCTGEPAFTALKKAFGDRYLYAGLGSKVELLQ